MGADCPATQAERPAQGVKPDCAARHPEKTFPKVVYTNGINNDAPTVCSTMHALANNRCVEVVGIFNATYADKSLTGPDRRWSDYRTAAGASLVGTALAGAPGALAGLPLAGVQEASRLGMVQDVLDCLDTIEGSGSDAATLTLAREIAAAAGANPPQPMTLFAHSQGGLNSAAAIAQAKDEIQKSAYQSLLSRGTPRDQAKAVAERDAAQRLSQMEVNTFGTLERGFVDGPRYNRYTNGYDPVPVVIGEAQRGLVPAQLERDPAGARPVTRFAAAPSFNPIDAHGMEKTYLPYLDRADPRGPCC
jgi:hypothetical protein